MRQRLRQRAAINHNATLRLQPIVNKQLGCGVDRQKRFVGIEIRINRHIQRRHAKSSPCGATEKIVERFSESSVNVVVIRVGRQRNDATVSGQNESKLSHDGCVRRIT